MNELLRNLVLIFLVAGAFLHVSHWLRVPSTVGLLIAGIILGPHGIGILRSSEQITQLADIGILLLMFSIGLDFTSDRVREFLRAAGMGFWQMLICIAVTTFIAAAFVERWVEAVFLGFLVAHTSSTLMLKLFLDRGELSSPQVRLGLGISITQDLSVVPMLLAVPMMASGRWALADFGLALLRAAAALAVAAALARWVIPLWLHQVMRSRSRELFLIFLMVVCLGTAWATTEMGLSIALGAFLAGLAIAGSAYSHQTLAEVVPFRDLLVSLFFISIGMLLNVSSMFHQAGLAILLVLAVLLLKFVSGFLPVLLWKYPLRIATLVGLGIAQIGEFSFVLAHTGQKLGLINEPLFQLFILVAISTMLANPLLVAAGPAIQRAIVRIPPLGWLENRAVAEAATQLPALENHVIVAGYGVNGQNVIRALTALNLPHVVLDLNPDTIRQARAQELAVVYGDCTRVEVLGKAQLDKARVYVVAISDLRATRQTVQVARHVNPAVHIIVRTKYLAEIEVLRGLGANEVIAEEFETSLEILARTLSSYGLPRLRTEEIVQRFRGDAYLALRGPAPLPPDNELLRQLLPALEIETVLITAASPHAGKSIRDINLRARTGATLLAVQREGNMETVPPPDYQIREQDLLVLAGTPHQIANARRLLEQQPV